MGFRFRHYRNNGAGPLLISVAIPSWSLRENLNQHDSCDEASYVRPKGDASRIVPHGSCASKSTAEKLNQEPVTKDNPGGKPPESEEYNERNQRQDFCSWIKQKICTHDSSNRSARPRCGNVGSYVEKNVRDSCGKTAEQIKNQVRKVAELVFNVVTENPKHPHIPNNVPPSAVQKHGC